MKAVTRGAPTRRAHSTPSRARHLGAALTSSAFARLLPLLAVLVVVTYMLPPREDDEAGYIELARNLADGFYATGRPDALLDADPSYPDLWFGPGFPLLLVGPVAAGIPLELVRLTGPLLLFAALLVFHALVRRTLAPRLALAATWALGLYLPFYTVLPNLHSEPLAIALVVVAMYAIARAHDEDRSRWILLGAGALGALALTRVAYGWVLTIALLIFLAWRLVTGARVAGRMAAMTALALALCVPWLAYTTSETGRLLQWGNSGALSLYWVTTPTEGLHGDWFRPDRVFTNPRLAAERPFFESLRGLALPEQNARLERQAFLNMKEHPREYLGNVGDNITRLFFDTPYSDDLHRSATPFFALSNALLLGALAVTIFLVASRRSPAGAPGKAFAVLAMPALVLHVLVATYPRMLLPIVPLAIWFIATAVPRKRSGRLDGAEHGVAEDG